MRQCFEGPGPGAGAGWEIARNGTGAYITNLHGTWRRNQLLASHGILCTLHQPPAPSIEVLL